MATESGGQDGRAAEGQPPETKDAPCTGSRESDGREGSQRGGRPDKAMVDTRRAKQDWTSQRRPRSGGPDGPDSRVGGMGEQKATTGCRQLRWSCREQQQESLPLGIYLKNEGSAPLQSTSKG